MLLWLWANKNKEIKNYGTWNASFTVTGPNLCYTTNFRLFLSLATVSLNFLLALHTYQTTTPIIRIYIVSSCRSFVTLQKLKWKIFMDLSPCSGQYWPVRSSAAGLLYVLPLYGGYICYKKTKGQHIFLKIIFKIFY